MAEHRLNALLFSNPCNPTGALVRGDALDQYVQVARASGCWLLLDEFYSHFVFDDDDAPGAGPVSAAAYVDDVERDPVVIVDGLTKNHRYPGLRVGWVVGPADVVDAVARTASAIDGGPPTVVQRLAISALEPIRADQETHALRQVFARKRKLMLEALTEMGIEVPVTGNGTFYLWGRVDKLPPSLRSAEVFFRAGLQKKVMTVPGRYFDVNPGQLRPVPHIDDAWVRFSFGPPEANMLMGLERLKQMIQRASS